jgi:peptidoglycan/LPS O-acetylase OafA/YrhL
MAQANFRQNNFDFLRFLLAFIVIIGHITRLSGVESLKSYAFMFPVFTGFFCISGFLVTISYNRTDTLYLFFKKRARRILPPYILVVVTCAVALSFVSSYSFQEYFTNLQLFKYLIANLTFLNFIEPCLPGVFTSNAMCAINGSLWTIKVEVMFYLLLPVIIYFVNRIKRKYILLVGLNVFAVIYRNSLLSIDGSLMVMFARQLPGMLSYFVCGIALYYYFDFFIKYKKIFFAVGLILFVFERMMGLDIFTPFATSAIVYSFAYSFPKLNNFGKYGDISYGIYIFHFPIIQLAVYFGFFERNNPFFVACCIIVVTLTMGFLSWHLLEKKFLKR